MSMKNIGSTDHIARIVLGVVLIALALTGVFSPWGWIGLVPLVTAIVGVCPIYSIFGMRTCKLD
ncbi:MAG: putative RND superfamily exporter protein [Paracoccaceae bacterium]|jgi:predicted RND superfamily exporter protein